MQPVKMPTLLQRGRTWSFRRVCPRELRPLIGGKREWVKALNTRDEAEARILAMKLMAETDVIIARLRATLKKVARTPLTPAQVAQAHASGLLRDSESWNLEDEGVIEGIDVDRHMAIEVLEGGRSASINRMLDAVLNAHQMHVTEALRRPYTKALAEAHVQALSVIEQRAEGGQQVTLDALLKAYLKDRARMAPRTAEELRALWQRFTLAMAGKPAPAITRADVRAWKDTLAEDGRSQTTVSKAVRILGAVFRFGVQNDLVPTNPCDGLSRSVGIRGRTVDDQKRQSYSAGDLGKLFSGDFMQLKGWRYYAPLVALFSGCRLAEVAGLEKADVGFEQGVHFLHIRPTTTRAVKSAASVRRVPIHSAVVKAGFLKFVEKASGPAVFADLKPAKHGRVGGEVTRFWRAWATQHGVTSANLTFHSLRGTFLDGLRAAGVDPELRERLLGHAPASVHQKYGMGFDLKKLNKAVQAVTFPSVKL